MLKHQLSNLIEHVRPKDIRDFKFEKYVEIHKANPGSTDPELVKKIEEEFFAENTDVEIENLTKIWEFMRPKVENNVGMAEFILDYDGAKSKYFFPWLINVFRSPATALEISYGAGPDLSGEWNDDILNSEPNDPLIPFILDDPAFVYNRERQHHVADLVTTFQDIAWDNEYLNKVVDFGAGRLAWARRHGFEFKPNLQDIYAFDKDPSIDPNNLFTQPLSSLGLRYKHGDFTAQFTNPDCKEAGLIILGGVASYIPPDAFAGKIMPAIYNLLVEGGVFFFDLQTETPCYRHSMDILDWPEIILPDSPSKVIDYAESVRKKLWNAGIKFNAEYTIDTYNKIPSAVMVEMQKL